MVTKIQLPLQLREGILLGKSLWMLVLKSCRCAPAVEATLVLGDAPDPSLSPHWRSQSKETKPLECRYYRTKKYILATIKAAEICFGGCEGSPAGRFTWAEVLVLLKELLVPRSACPGKQELLSLNSPIPQILSSAFAS